MSVVPRITLPSHGTANKHAAIGGFGHHQGGIATQKFTVHHHMHALAGRHHGFGRAASIGTIGCAVFLAQRIDPDTRRIDDTARLNAIRAGR